MHPSQDIRTNAGTTSILKIQEETWPTNLPRDTWK